MTISPEHALVELTILNAETAQENFEDVFLAGLRKGIPAEVLTRLRSLWDQTRVIAGEVITVGKIVVHEIGKFLHANPKLAIGLALGAAIGSLITAIPLIGPLLAPLSILLTSLYGAGVGATMHTASVSTSPVTAALQLANSFFELLVSIFNAIAAHWVG